MAEWISVKDRLPELTETDGFLKPQLRVYFVVKGKVHQGYACQYFVPLIFFQDNGNGYFPEEITHWMANPLPDPPEGK